MFRKITHRGSLSVLFLLICLVGLSSQALGRTISQAPKLAPPALYGLSLVNVNNQIYLFGGYKETPTLEGPSAISLSNELWHWVSEPDNWELVDTHREPSTGACIPQRSGG